MYLVGLTGGIAAGKSTVAAEWSRLGGIEIDADQLAREVVQPGTAGLAAVAEEFGKDVLNGDSLNREALGKIVFSNDLQRTKLEAILHPLIRNLAAQRIAQLPEDSIVIYNVPLLVESPSQLEFDKVVTVEAPVDKQIDRLVEFRGMTKEDAKARIEAQATPAQRANAADIILNSNQDIKHLLKDARRVFELFEAENRTDGSH